MMPSDDADDGADDESLEIIMAVNVTAFGRKCLECLLSNDVPALLR